MRFFHAAMMIGVRPRKSPSTATSTSSTTLATFILVVGFFASCATVSSALRCFVCEGNSLTCELANNFQYCTSPEMFCRLDVNTISYPYVKQQCSSSCVENVKPDGTGYTYCTRVDLGNCYRQQCNRVSGAESVAKPPAASLVLVAAATAVLLAGGALAALPPPPLRVG